MLLVVSQEQVLESCSERKNRKSQKENGGGIVFMTNMVKKRLSSTYLMFFLFGTSNVLGLSNARTAGRWIAAVGGAVTGGAGGLLIP